MSASPPMLRQESLHRAVQWLQKEKLEIVVKRPLRDRDFKITTCAVIIISPEKSIKRDTKL